MCIFSGNVDSVSKTQIFAKRSAIGKQFLVYRMNYETNQELAMILPLPTPVMASENAVRFMDLSGYPEFFQDMNKGFMIFDIESRSKGMSHSMSKSMLAVQDVGSFEASFVPSLQDFDRLDPRFRLSEITWQSLPRYQDYGFAVFKLKPGNLAAHPMAFEFPIRLESILFFPTTHVHNGQVESFADFDHALYFQRREDTAINLRWNLSQSWGEKRELLLAQDFINIDKTEGIVDGQLPIYRQLIKGENLNTDTLVTAK